MREHLDIPGRVTSLEKDMGQVKTGLAKIIAWGTAAGAIGSLLLGGLLSVIAWNATRTVNQLDSVSMGVSEIKTDVAVLKSEKKTEDRSWRLITQLAKKGASDVSKTLNDE